MIQVGIFTGYFPYALEETARRVRAHGFNTVQLDLGFKDMDLATEAITTAKCRKIRDAFRAQNLPVCAVSGYTNIIHPDPAVRRANVERLKTIIRHAWECGSPYVITETGTYNPDSDWAPHPDNFTEAGYQECRDVIGELTGLSVEHGATLLLEPYVSNVIASVEITARLFKDIPGPGLALLMDPTNYFDGNNIGHMDVTLNHMFDVLGDRIRISHAKDVKPSYGDTSEKHVDIDASEGHTFRGIGDIELPAPGLGMLNYDLYLRLLYRRYPNIPIIIEHLEEPDVARAKTFLDERLMAVGA
jgi:sugar phosphate isomerase/epimerase